MKKILLLLGLMIVLLASGVMAVDINDTQYFIGFWGFNNESHKLTEYSGNSSNFVEQGTPTFRYENSTLNWWDTGNNNFLNASCTLTEHGWSIFFWFNSTENNGVSSKHILQFTDGTSDEQLSIYYHDSDTLRFVVEVDNAPTTETDYSYPADGLLHLIGVTMDAGGNWLTWIDASNELGDSTNTPPNWLELRLGTNRDRDTWMDNGGIHAIGVVNYPLDQANWTWLYNQKQYWNPFDTGGGASPPAGTPDTINISDTVYPAHNTQYNYSAVNINFTVNASYNFNCSLYLNSVLNETQLNLNSGTNVFVNFSNNYADGTFDYYVNCSDNQTSEITSTRTFYVDTVFPTLSTNHTNSSHYKLGDFINNWFSCTDDILLHTFNVSIDGTDIYGNNTFNSTSINYTLNYNTTNLSIGVHNLSIYCADGHTAEKLKGDYKVKIPTLLKNELKFEFDGVYNEGYITIESTDIFDVWSAEKKYDRYSFDLEPDKKKSKYDFDVESSFPIKIVELPNSEWKKWIIFDEHWLDFAEEDGFEIDIERINPKKVRVSVSGLKDKTKFKFNSIGDLNVVTADYYFYSFNATETFTTPTAEADTVTFTLNLTKNSSYITDADASLNYNGTWFNPTKSTSAESIYFSQNIFVGLIDSGNQLNNSFNWVYNTTGTTNNTYNTTLRNQTVDKMIIGNCTSAPSNRTINFTYLDEIYTSTKVNATASGVFTVWNGNVAYSRNHSFSYGNDVHSEACISPDYATLNANLQMTFDPILTYYNNENYYENNKKINTTLQTIQIYFLNLTTSTEVTITVLDNFYEPVLDYLVEAHRYNLVGNNFTLVGTEETDSNGQVEFDLNVDDYEYKFIVKDTDGIQVYESATMKLFSAEYTFRLPASTSDTLPEQIISALTYTLNYNSTTRNVSLTWSDLTGIASRHYLEAYNHTTNTSNPLSVQTSTASSGAMSYIVPNASGYYTVNYYIDYSNNSKKYYVDGEMIDIRDEWDVFGTETLILALLYIGVLAFVGITIRAEVGIFLSVVGLIAMYIFGMINLGTGLVGLMGMVVTGLVLIFRLYRR